MNTLELQHNLIKKILNITDNQFLSFLNNIISDKEDTSVYELSEFEKKLIKESQEDYKNGNVLSNEEVFSETEKWLKK